MSSRDSKICDHTSVGMLVWRNKKLLLIERKNAPFGFAPPAGHVDTKSSYEEAAKNELLEEVGLVARKVKLVIEGRKDFACRRIGGTWHYWKIYEVKVSGKIKRSERETKQVGWFSQEQIKQLAEKTKGYIACQVSERAWQNSPGIEPVWYEWFQELNGYI